MTPARYTAARKRLGLSGAAFARELGMSRNTHMAYERGRARIPRYIALAISALLYGLRPLGE